MQDEKDTLINNEGVSSEESTSADLVADEAVLQTGGSPSEDFAQKSAGKRFPRKDGNKRNTRKGRGRDERPRSEFDQKILAIRRVTRVVAGGRRLSFAVVLVAGNRKGKVGVGTGKAVDTSLAIEKAFRNAKKNMINIQLSKSNSIPHDVRAKYSSSVISIIPSRGRGLVAGGAVRSVLELGGVTDVTAKLLSRSKNAINNAEAAVKALGTIRVRK